MLLDLFVNCYRRLLQEVYLRVAGMKRGRMSLCGLLLIVCGIIREMLARKHETVRICPEMTIAVALAFLSMRRDVTKLIRCFKFWFIVNG